MNVIGKSQTESFLAANLSSWLYEFYRVTNGLSPNISVEGSVSIMFFNEMEISVTLDDCFVS